ncbi:MAG: exo-alpha-sialidase [Clostridia bacterium]|nr:exo-alpha-sialidase [Clostridia bacterium]
MNEQLKRMEQALSQEDRRMLQSVYEPQVVTIPPSDACCNMCVTSEGEIRIYGTMGKKEPTDMGTTVYLSSKDCGLSWKTHYMEHGVLGAATYNPETGRYIAFHPQEHRPDRNALIGKEGTWAILSEKGHDSADYRLVKMSEREVFIMRPPMYLKSCKRWLIIGEYNYPERVNKTIVVFYSDDDGESWTERELLPSAPPFVVKPPHKGPRWQQYSAEPTIAELVDGELVMFVRTSQDYYYTYRSADHGDHWTGPEPSPFHGTITMPVLQKLSDGRIVFFWCNTQPMPELDHTQAFPPLTPRELTGYSEDVFTNRDANHLAVTEDDMQSWIGLRELFLNPIRNNGDFRSIGGANSKDKSVHQAQMVELPYHKLLIHFGQNTSARKVVLLDVNWLYEQERKEDFRLGLQNVSTQMYVKSNMGNYRGWSGHCAYNRTQGALLVPDPSGNAKEVLQICRIEDERLVYKKQGAVWNFPASKKGRVEVELRVVKSGVALCLTDH